MAGEPPSASPDAAAAASPPVASKASPTLPVTRPAVRPWAGGALASRDFRLLLVMQLASGVRQPMLFFAQAWYVNLAAPPSQRVVLLGLLGAIRGAVFLAYALVGGAVADRFPRRRTLVASHAVAVLLSSGIALLLYVPAVARGEGPWLWAMFPLFASFGLITGQDQPTRTAMVRDAVPTVALTSAVTLHQFAMSLAFIPAAPLVGWMLDELGVATTYLLSGLGHLIVIGAAFAMRSPDVVADPGARGESVWSNLRAGFGVVREDPVVRWTIYLTWLVLAAGMSVMSVLIAAWVHDVLGLDASGWGWMALFWGIGGILASGWLAWQGEYGRKGQLFLGASALMGTSVLAFGLSRSIAPAFLFNGLAGLANALVLTVGIAIVQQAVPNRLLGRVTALLMLSQGIMQLTGLLVGAAGQLLGLSAIYPAAGIAILVFTLLTALRQRPLRTAA